MTDIRGKYAKLPIVFDFSFWQSKADKTTSVNWDALAKYPEIAGGYVKLGQVGNVGFSWSRESDYWFDPTFESNLEGMQRNKMWTGVYIYHNSTWAIDRGITEKGMEDLNSGSTEDEKALNLLYDPNVYLIARRLKIGLGRDKNLVPAMKTMPEKENIDAIVVDFEDAFSNNGTVIGDVWLGKTLKQTMDGLSWLMEKGYLKKRKLMIYTSEWFLKQYANVHGRNVCDNHDMICAGYYWSNKYGVFNTTVPGMILEMAKVPNNWQPYNCGAAVPGKRVQFYQISGDYFTLPEVTNPSGGRSAVDVNVFNASNPDNSWEEMKKAFPEWAKRRFDSTTPPPPPPPPPPPVETKLVADVVVNTLNVRNLPSTVSSIIQGQLFKGTTVDVLETKLVGKDIWRKVKLEVWVADTVNSVKYLNVKEVPK